MRKQVDKREGTFLKLQSRDLNPGLSGFNAHNLSTRPYGLHKTPYYLHCEASFK